MDVGRSRDAALAVRRLVVAHQPTDCEGVLEVDTGQLGRGRSDAG